MAVQLLPGPFTVADYYRMAETGILRPDERVELLDGQVVPKVTIGPRHQGCVNFLDRALQRLAGAAALVQVQGPVGLDERSVPEPDVALLRPRADSYRSAHPRPDDTLLVIEVADTSLDYDRDIKLPLYARAGIRDAWLVDLTGERIIICRDPVAGAYTSLRDARRGDAIAPLLLPHISLAVDEILG